MSTKFPDNFLIGFSTSAYQIEGGWNLEGKGESIWDRYTHTHSERIGDHNNGDIACDSFHQYKKDIKLLKEMGAQTYRFSISWSRIMPSGFSNDINQKGVNYYKSLIDELTKNNIEPVVTLYHWDLPQKLQDLGGWPNPMLIDLFSDYAEFAFTTFGDKVKKWITFNEPEVDCPMSLGVGTFAPGLDLTGIADYQAGHNILKAHAKAYHLYDSYFRGKQKGEIGIALSMMWKKARTTSPKDLDAATTSIQFNVGWFGNPIFSETGDYPEVMKKLVAEESKKQGYKRSRLPEFDKFWVDYIKGTADFFGLNHYTTQLASWEKLSSNDQHLEVRAIERDSKVILSAASDWVRTNGWLNIVPWGFRKCLMWIKNEYGDPKIYVTENGINDVATFNDKLRINYHQSYLKEMLKAIYEDGVRVEMYQVWSFMDNFEWAEGYTQKFGIYFVDFNDPERKRVPKKSAEYFKQIIKKRKLPDSLKEYDI